MSVVWLEGWYCRFALCSDGMMGKVVVTATVGDEYWRAYRSAVCLLCTPVRRTMHVCPVEE